MTSLLWLDALTLRELIRKKELSPVEVLGACLERLREVEPHLNAFVDLTEERARESARQSEQKIMRGEPLGLLEGLPISVKDLISVEGAKLTFGSRAMANNRGVVDAPAVERAGAQGAAVIGKTTTSEFGCKGVGDSSLTGITRNPWNLSKTPGGSSCGAAASVAAGVTPFALGTDGGGSIRIPASMTGLFGIKAHFGRVPVFPISATPTLAHVSPISRTVRDAALLLNAVAGFDPRDAASLSEPVPDFVAACDKLPIGLRVAWSPTLGYANPSPEIVALCERAVGLLQRAGCEVTLVEKVFDDPLDLFMAEFFAGGGTRLRPVLENDRQLLDPAVAATLDNALQQSMHDYYTKVFKRYDFRTHVTQFFAKYDLLITPTLPVTAFDVGENMPPGYSNMFGWISYTYPFNLTGLPAASVPCGCTAAGFPVGLQMVGRHLREVDIFSAASALEEAQPWAVAKPPI